MMARLYDRWWSNFIQWSIIIVPLLFSLWLAGWFLEVPCPTVITSNPTEINDLQAELNICEASQMVFALGALVIGIMMSMSFSAEGSQAIIKGARRLYQGGVNASGRWVSRQIRDVGGSTLYKDVTPEKAKGVTSSVGKPIKTVLQLPGIKQLVAPIRKGYGAGKETYQQEWKKVKGYDNYSPTALLQALNYTSNSKERAKITDLLVNKHPDKFNEHVDKLKTDDKANGTKKFEKFAKEMNARSITMPGSEKSVLEIRPDIAKQLGKDIGEVIAKATEKSMRNWSPGVLKDPGIVDELIKQDKFTKSFVADIGKDIEKTKALEAGISAAYGLVGGAVEDVIKRRTGSSFANNISTSPNIAALLKTARKKDIGEEIREALDSAKSGGTDKDTDKDKNKDS
ncbi:MAG: hypothetical protein WD712_01200 [Candidatus Spechtbacterales bacterium]